MIIFRDGSANLFLHTPSSLHFLRSFISSSQILTFFVQYILFKFISCYLTVPIHAKNGSFKFISCYLTVPIYAKNGSRGSILSYYITRNAKKHG